MPRNKTDILNGDISKQILLLFYPILFGTFFQQLYNTVDAIIVGNYISKQALGAVGGTTGTLINLLVGFITGLASGATVIIAQYYGRRDGDSVSKSVKTGMFLAVLMGAVIMVLGITLAPMMLKATDVPEDIYGYSLTYMRVYFSGLIPSMIYNVGASILRAIGDSKRPLYFLIISTFVNIILDIIFVRFFNWSVFGAALATIISQFVSCLLTLYVLKKTDDSYYFELKMLGCDMSLLEKIILIGLPSGVQSVLYSITNVFIQKNVNSFGTDAVAAFTAFGKIDAIFWMFSGAIGIAAMTVAGQNYGAGNVPRVKETIKKGLLIYCIFTIALSSGVYFFGEFFLKLFSSDVNVVAIGYRIVKFMAPTWITFAVIEILSSCIRACGDSLYPMLFTAIGICGFRMIYLLFCPNTDIIQTMWCYPLSWIITSICLGIYYLSGIWLKRCSK